MKKGLFFGTPLFYYNKLISLLFLQLILINSVRNKNPIIRTLWNEWPRGHKNLSEAKIFMSTVSRVTIPVEGIFWFSVPPPLYFLPANLKTQIRLGGTLKLISAFQRNFSTPVSMIYGVGNMKKKNFAPPKNCGGASKPKYSGELHHGEFESTVILLNLLATFFLSQHLFQNFSINFFLILTPKFLGYSWRKVYFDELQ